MSNESKLTRARGGWSAMARPAALTEEQQKALYLAMIGRLGTLSAGCRAARCSPHSVYKWREHDTAFAVAEHEARNAFADRLEEEAVRRAYTGTLKPVYQQGSHVGDVREFDTPLLMMLLRAVRPKKYRERIDVHRTSEPTPKVYAGVSLDDL